MKILITGAQGQVGSELVKTVDASNFDVLAATRNELDITQSKIVETYIQLHKPDIVINAAAYTAVDKAEKESVLAETINHHGTENLAISCAKHNIPLFHISTDYIFDGSKSEPYLEDDNSLPLGVYGESKWLGEQAIRQHIQNFIILRVAWVFGTTGNNFVKTMLRLGKEKDEINVVADQYGGPSPANDISQTLVSLAKRYQQDKKLPWGTYHYCGTPKTSWYEFATEIFKQANEMGLISKKIQVSPITTIQYPTPAKRPANSMLNCSKLKDTFGIDMPDWRESLKQILVKLK